MCLFRGRLSRIWRVNKRPVLCYVTEPKRTTTACRTQLNAYYFTKRIKFLGLLSRRARAQLTRAARAWFTLLRMHQNRRWHHADNERVNWIDECWTVTPYSELTRRWISGRGVQKGLGLSFMYRFAHCVYLTEFADVNWLRITFLEISKLSHLYRFTIILLGDHYLHV